MLVILTLTVTITYLSGFRIHFLAGVLDGADPQRDKAETTYVENLKYAAVECAKV